MRGAAPWAPGEDNAHTEQEAAHLVRAMFGRVARRYDLANHLLSFSIDRYWRAHTARRLRHILANPAARVLDICEHDEDRVAALEAEIGRLTEAFESKELPFPRTPAAMDKFEGNLAELKTNLQLAQETLAKRRAANPLPPD